jgi:soluble lytic murein transglycosylase-like protein
MEKIVLLIIITWFFMSRPPVYRAIAESVVKDWLDLVKKYQAFYPQIAVTRILAHICVESAGNPSAIGDKLASHPSIGLMQVRLPALIDFNKAYGKNYTENDLLTPYKNIEAGVGYLSLRLRKWNDLSKATMAYNGGDGNVGSALTLQYLNKIELYEALVKSVTNGSNSK